PATMRNFRYACYIVVLVGVTMVASSAHDRLHAANDSPWTALISDEVALQKARLLGIENPSVVSRDRDLLRIKGTSRGKPVDLEFSRDHGHFRDVVKKQLFEPASIRVPIIRGRTLQGVPARIGESQVHP